MFADHSIMHIGTHVARRTAMLEGRAPQPPSSSPSPSSSSSPPPRRPRDNAVRKMRTAPLTGEHVEDFFFPASRGPSLALQKNSSSLSSQSTKSTRTVSSLRSEPMHFAVGTAKYSRQNSFAPISMYVCRYTDDKCGILIFITAYFLLTYPNRFRISIKMRK